MAARLRPEVSVEQADREMNALSERLFREHPTEYAQPGMLVVRLHEQITHEVRPALLAVLGAVGLVLLIACANVTNLLLARAGQRREELAVRAALGATRWRVMRSLLAESLVLASLGGALGLVLAASGVRLLVAISPPGLPRLEQIGLDSKVLIFAIVVTTLVGVTFGLIPGLQITRGGLWRGLRQGGRRILGGSHRARATLVVAQVALTLTLLVGAGLLLRSLVALLLAAVGLFGVLASVVAERRTEIGVRTALGATRGNILKMVAWQGLSLTLAGAALGFAATIGLGRVIEGLLFEVSRVDPITYVGVTALLVAVAALACWIPARRAAQVDPVEALRAE